MKHLYFAYGSNLNLGQMAHRCSGAKPVARGYIPNMELFFYSVASIRKVEGAKVWGGIWEINKKHLLALDRYEGFPHLYRREMINVYLPDKKVSVNSIVYIMNIPDDLEYPPSDVYYDCIYQGYSDFRLQKKPLRIARSKSIESGIEDYIPRADVAKRNRKAVAK